MERQRIDSATREALTIVYAAAQAIEKVGVLKLERMSRRVPNGWRDLKMVSSRLNKLVENLLDTLPTKQLETMIAQMRISHLKVVMNEAGKAVDGQWIVPREDLAALADAVIGEKCMLCDRDDWYNCNLRRIITDLPVEGMRKSVNRCWRDEE